MLLSLPKGKLAFSLFIFESLQLVVLSLIKTGVALVLVARLHNFSKRHLDLIPALPLPQYTDPMITLGVVLNLLAMLQAQVEHPY